MGANLSLALQITLLGMGLVFAAILLLWALMALLVRVVRDPAPDVLPAPEAFAEAEAAAPAEAQPAESGREALRKRAAALAVATALALNAESPSPGPGPGAGAAGLPATAFVSAWQAVMRANQMRQRGSRR